MFFGVVVGWAAGECHAVNVTVLPRIPISLPATLGMGGGLTGSTLGTSAQGSIAITDPVPNPGIQSQFDSYSVPLNYAYGDPFGESLDGRAVSVGTTEGFINSKAIARPGKLRAFASAGGGGGSVTGIATATALFVDIVSLKLDDGYKIDLDVHGTLSGGYSILTPDVRPRTRPGAGAQMRSQVWWIPIDVNLAQASQSNFFGSYYHDTSWVYDIQTDGVLANIREIKATAVGDVAVRGPVGAKFWVVGLLEVTAARGAGDGGTIYPSSFVAGTADLLNTVDMTIEALSAPGQSGVTSFSGHDYSPGAVPEPSSVILLSLGGAAILLRRRMAGFQASSTN